MTPFHLLHLMSPLLIGYLYLGIFSELMIAGTLLNFTALDKALSPLHLVEMILKPPDEQGKQSPKVQRARRTRDGEKTKLPVMRKRKKHEASSVKKPCYWSTILLPSLYHPSALWRPLAIFWALGIYLPSTSEF